MLSRYDIRGRVGVFIDAANIFYSQRTLGWRIDFGRLAGYLKGEIDIKGMYYYTGKVGALAKQVSFLQKLQSLGYEVTAKEVKFIKTGGGAQIPKGNLDVELALDAFRLKENFDVFLLFSGDSDFAYLIDLLKQAGKRVFVLSTRGHVSKELLDRAKYIDLRRLRAFAEKIKGPDEPAPEV
ncbi:NYN domain-containing protein [Patescibacteria group bacterium]|nr:NYN domain-containing protein [Patescibacteria group bacterium]MDE1944648.1 NYN domain-containing protein [Patescibacteria group bacterium]